MPLYIRAKHTEPFRTDVPSIDDKMGLGAMAIRRNKLNIQERMELDHYWGEETDTAKANADGYHKKVTLKNVDEDIERDTDSSTLYVKNDELKHDGLQLTKSGDVNYVNNIQAVSWGYAKGVNQEIPNVTSTIDWKSKPDFPISNWMNIDTDKFPVVFDGLYLVSAQVLATNIELQICVNDVVVSRFADGCPQDSEYRRICGSDVLYLRARDYVTIKAKGPGTIINYLGIDEWFTIVRIG